MQIASCRSSVYVARVAWGLCILLVLADVNGQTPPSTAKKTQSPADKAGGPKTEGKAARPPAEAAKSARKTVSPAAQPDASEEEEAANAQEQKEKLTADRFLVVLEKNPRRGTALDKVYGFHVERGSLDQWLQQYRDRVAKQEQDGTAWLMLGLIEAHRGQDAAAVKALQKAEQYLPENAISSYYLGQSLVLVGQPELAAAALERALERKPAQNDLLEIFQTLGRVYQRAQQSEKALAVWERLEKLFPNDLRVQEQIALTLVEEGQAALALPRFEALAAKSTKDLYRQSQFKIQVAEIKIRLGKSKEGLADFEKLLDQLNPDNWLYRDVRHKIDEVFLRTDDQAGLAAYYESWIGKHPEDVDAMARLSRILAALGRAPEAQSWLEKGLKLAPSRKELRMAIIDQLVYDQKYPEAIQQYALLDQHEPNNPDTIRDWGRLILKDTSRPEGERKQAATDLWKKLLAAKSQDPVVTTQVADLFRHAELNDEALALYKKAIELAPNSAQYREYLGEYYHQLKQSEEALKTWREIALGKNRTAPNLARLGEVLIGFGYLAEGTSALADAVKLEPQDFELQMRLAKALNQGAKYEDSLKSLVEAEKLVTNPEESETVLQLQLANYQAAEKLPAQIEALEKELAAPVGDAAKQAARWYLLARFYETNRKLPEALRSALKSLELAPQSIPTLAATARIQEAGNSVLDAAETNRRLAAVDRRYRTQYLTQVAKLESRLGRRVEALKAGREVVASAPGSPDSYEFFAQLCFRLGENDEGLEALRRSVRVNPSEPRVVLALASALAEQFKTAEAIELYWRAFEKESEIEGKLDVISKLAELYLQTNHLDRMLDRLDRERRENAQQQRVMTLCIAQAYQSAGDYGSARVELERMLTPDTRDTPLLQQLAKLAESEGDYQLAIKYQEQLNKLSPKREGLLQLAHYLTLSGETEQATQLQLKVMLDEKDPERLLKNLDMLLQRGLTEQSLLITERLLRDEPKNWEYLYRDGVALIAKHPDRAEERFRQILALNIPGDELSLAAKAKLKPVAGQKPNQALAGMAMLNSPLGRHSMREQGVRMLRYSAGLDPRYRSGVAGMSWVPESYENARIGALGWLLSASIKKGQEEAFVDARRQEWEQAKTSSRVAWDWYYLQLLQSNYEGIHQAAKALASLPDSSDEAVFLYATSLSERGRSHVQATTASRATVKAEDNVPPLSNEELDFLLNIYKRASSNLKPLMEQDSNNVTTLVVPVVIELARAKRVDEAKQIFADAAAAARHPLQILPLLSKAASDGDYDQVMKLWDKLDKLETNLARHAPISPLTLGNAIPPLMVRRAADKAYPDVLKLLDRTLLFESQARRATMKATKSAKLRQSNSTGIVQNYGYLIYGPKGATRLAIKYPLPNKHFGFREIQLLRNAFVLYQDADLMTDLVQHFEVMAQRPETAPEDRLTWQLGLAYLNWWNEAQDLAVDQLRSIAKSLPEDQEFLLDLAELYANRNEFAECLELLDSMPTLDQDAMQRREKLALPAAIRLGETKRAREAAARLFGLRLDTETQVQLASQMKQLGMHDQAEAVMARAGRQAGNRLGALLSLMQEYQSQGKPETALQIAQTILRRTQTQQGTQRTQAQVDVSQARQSALQFLVTSGKLKELIERVEAQLKNSPNSIQIHQLLIEFNTAAGNREQARKYALRMAELNQHDPQARWQAALQLLNAGELDKATEHMRAALKQQPRLFGTQSWEVQNAFRKAKKIPDLIKVLDEIDLKAIGQSHHVMNIVQNIMNEGTDSELGMKLFRRAWESFPNERPQMLASISQEQIWQLPEMYTYAKETFISSSGKAQADPWAAFQVRSYDGNGKVTGGLNHIMLAAKKQNKLEELEREIAETLDKNPAWHGGRAMLAIVKLQRGDLDAASKIVEEILNDKQQGLPMHAAWLIGQELHSIPKGDVLAMRFYEYAAQLPDSSGIGQQFEYSPKYILVKLYSNNGKKEQARELLLKTLANSGNESPYDAEYAAYQRLQNQDYVATALQEMDFGADSLRIYGQMAGDREGQEQTKRIGGESYLAKAEKGIEKALASIRPEQFSNDIKKRLDQTTGTQKESNDPAVDFFLTVERSSSKPAHITSFMASVFAKTAKSPEIRAEVIANLTKLQASHPDDISALIATALLTQNDPQPELFAKAAEQLDQWIAAHPLEVLAPNKRANSRQRTVAERQIPLWLVARECVQRESLREIGKRLGARAAEAARCQINRDFALAILKELGQIEWGAGDKAGAVAHWSEALELIVARSEPTVVRAAPPAIPNATPTPGASPAIPRAKQPAEEHGTGPLTVTQFNQVIELAKVVEACGLHELSFKAVGKALSGGPPVVEMNANTRAMATNRPRSSRDMPDNQIDMAVLNGIWELQQLWSKHNAPAEQVYAVLSDIVFPAARAEEILVYARPLPGGDDLQPRSLGLVLVKRAILAHQETELREKISQRNKSAAAAFHGQLLLTMLAIESKDIPQAKLALEELTKKYELRQLQDSAELVCQLAVPVLENEELSLVAQPLLARAVKQLSSVKSADSFGPVQNRYGTLQLRLAGLSFKSGKVENGNSLLTDYLNAEEALYQNYDLDYSQHMRRQALLRVTSELAKGGRIEEALQRLGEMTDLPKLDRYSRIDDSKIGPIIFKGLQGRPAAERYQLLKSWTLPVEGRKTLRMSSGFGPEDSVPPNFVKGLLKLAGADRVESKLLSSAKLLVQSAEEAGKLDELAAEVQPLADQKIAGAAELLALIKVTQKKLEEAAPAIKLMLDDTRKTPLSNIPPGDAVASVWDRS